MSTVTVYLGPSLSALGAAVCGFAVASQPTSSSSAAKRRGCSRCWTTILLGTFLPTIWMVVGFGADLGAALAAVGAEPIASATATAITPAAVTHRVIAPRTIVRPPRPVVDMASRTAGRPLIVGRGTAAVFSLPG